MSARTKVAGTVCLILAVVFFVASAVLLGSTGQSKASVLASDVTEILWVGFLVSGIVILWRGRARAPRTGLVHGQVGTLPAEPAVAPAPIPSIWMPTHTTPPAGMQAWDVPDPSRPVAIQLPPNLDLVVESSTGAWARVRAVNGWQGWVDGRLLVGRTEH